ncbi:hypothetical protein Tco_0242486, partial [Tanacetum coccineum]
MATSTTLSPLPYSFRIQLSKVSLPLRRFPGGMDACKVWLAMKWVTLRRFPEVKGWLDEDLDNYHLKELHCSTQCHTQMSMWIISRGVVLLILLMLGIRFPSWSKVQGSGVLRRHSLALMLERLSRNEYYCFLDGFSGFFQILIAPEDQEKMTFTCPYGTFAYRRMSFELCNAPTNFQRCMTVIFYDIVEDFMEVFMDDFSIKKGVENLAADHLSRLENPNIGELAEEEIEDKFPDGHLMILKAKLNDEEPWYADYVNYIVGKVVPLEWTPKKKKMVLLSSEELFWDEPYAFRLCPNNVMRRCVAGCEILKILEHCHSGPTRGHHSASVTGRKVYEAGFYWPSIFRDAKDY